MGRVLRWAGLGLVLAAACTRAHEAGAPRAGDADALGPGPTDAGAGAGVGADAGMGAERAAPPGTRGDYTSSTPSGSAATQEGTAGLVTSGTGDFGAPSPGAPASGTDRKPAAGIEAGETRLAPDAGSR